MAPAATEWGKLKVVDLKAELKKRGLAVAGRKDDLVHRLVEADREREGEVEGEVEGVVEGEAKEGEVQDQDQGQDEAAESVREATAVTSAATSAVTPDSVSTQTADIEEPLADVTAADAEHDGQKRKRSASPDDDSSKRPRMAESVTEQLMTEQEVQEEEVQEEEVQEQEVQEQESQSQSPQSLPSLPSSHPSSPDIPPAIHPATAALYIRNFMRPLRPAALDDHLVYLAASPTARRAGDLDPSALVQSYLDAIKTHAFVVFRTARQAARVRAALHGRVWPGDSNRRPLWVDFVPPESVPGWMAQEREAAGPDNRSTQKWEVVYADRSDDGTVATTLQVVGQGGQGGQGRPPPPSGPANFDNVPRGPRFGNAAQRGGRGQEMDREQTTRASPVLDFRMVHPDLARRRLDNIRYLESPRGAAAAAAAAARSSDYARNNNRYTFEDGAQLVDRGPEMFDGIRPPHREGERRWGGRGRGRRPGYNEYRPQPWVRRDW